MKTKITAWALILVTALGFTLYQQQQLKKDRQLNRYRVQALVERKLYNEAYVRYIPMSKETDTGGVQTVLVPTQQPEEHFVKLRYNDTTTAVDDKQLYNDVKVGDKITVTYIESPDGKIKKILMEGR